MSRFDVIKFLEYYQRYPCLWDKNDPDFKIREKRDAAEQVLQSAFGIATKKELRAKIRSLRCTYNQEVAKVIKSQMAGWNSQKLYKPKLSWFEYADSFLKKNREDKEESIADLVVSERLVNDETQDGHGDHRKESQQGSDDDINVSAEVDGELVRKTTVLVNHQKERSKKRKIENVRPAHGRENKLSKIDSELQKAITTLKRVSDNFSDNEFAVFGQLVGIQLSKFPLQTALLLQREIQDLITQARLNLFLPPSPHSDISPSTPISITPSLVHSSEHSETSLCGARQTYTPPVDLNSHIS